MAVLIISGKKDEVRKTLQQLVGWGEKILKPLTPYNIEPSLLEETRWRDYVLAFLEKHFSSDTLPREFRNTGRFTASRDPWQKFLVINARLKSRINKLQSIIDRLELYEEKGAGSQSGHSADAPHLFPSVLHIKIAERCQQLFHDGHYAEAVENSFKVVRDRLRDLTGYETGADAFGKGRLHINGAVADIEVTVQNFNKGVQFLCMAIDMFRNEKAHHSAVGVTDQSRALQYLVLSSLAMRLLDHAEVRANRDKD